MENAPKAGLGCMIVTGASRGVGAAIALLAGQRGYSVVVNYAENANAAAAIVKKIKSAGSNALAVQADVAVEKDVSKLFHAADEAFGPLRVLVNNAGITGGFARVDQVSAATLARVLAVNVTGSFLCAGEAVKRMSTRHGGRGGSIINISSRAAIYGCAGEWVHYAATKGAIDTLTVGLAREVAQEGIRVNTVAPGLIESDLHAAAGAPDRPARMAPSIPAGRPGVPDEVAGAVLWLASEEASYVTGATIAVSGGR
jgi:NAD(P)-dependent dehydrogenase (short-subunit alcohol dehydrogenase family)